jgi:hypothetical protein
MHWAKKSTDVSPRLLNVDSHSSAWINFDLKDVGFGTEHFVDKCAVYLSRSLGEKFREYHQNRKVVSAIGQDFSKLTGVDFEVYVARVLKEADFEDIAGTSATGDQGADLIAKRNGKTIAIQVKGLCWPRRKRSSARGRCRSEVLQG